jgi:hypothetical protein
LRILNLQDDDPIGREVAAARERALHAALASFGNDQSPLADALREEFTIRLGPADGDGSDPQRAIHAERHRAALDAARRAVLAMRANDEIGDDAFHRMEEELDWHEMAIGTEA